MSQHTTRLNIQGMSCKNCVGHARQALLSVPGVLSAEVVLEPGSATVVHGDEATVEAMIAAIVEEGYEATLEG